MYICFSVYLYLKPLETIFLAFSNQPVNPLPTLQEEDDQLNRLLAPRAKERHFLLHRESFATLEKTAQALTLYRDQLVVFLYSGHATRDTLLLPDFEAGHAGIAQMLGQCPNLKLAFLNGCSTEGQVKTLLEQGVPVVLATSAPVDDRKAAFFSIRFFDALQQQFSILEAFNMAKGAAEAAYEGLQLAVNRGLGFDKSTENEPVWGLFYKPEKAHVLDWKLPAKPALHTEASDFQPNLFLIETLFRTLGAFNGEIEALAQKESRGVQVPLPKKRMAVLNALPAPLAEPLRKLMVPVEQENDGYDKVGEARLRQINQAYQTAMEMFVFILLAQLWEARDAQPELRMEPQQQEVLRAFFRLSGAQRPGADFMTLIRTIQTVFEKNDIHYFLEEMRGAGESILHDPALPEHLNFLKSLTQQLQNQLVERPDWAFLNERAERSLALLYESISFMARYKLATIQGIDVEKYRHRRIPRFNHESIVLHDLLGGFDYSAINLDKSLDNRSILLINDETWEYLNLSPFALDENAFLNKSELCKLYFFSHYLPDADVYCYKYVNKPDDPLLEISDQKYALVKEQFEAFAQGVLQQPMRAL